MSWRQNTLFSQRDCGPPGCSSPTEGSSMTWERGQHPFSRDISVQDARANSLVICLLSAESILFTKCFPMCDQQHDDIHLEMVVPSECPSPSAPLPPNFCSNITFSGRPVPPPCENCNLSTSERSSSFLAPFLHGFFCSPMQQPWAYPLQTSHSRQHSQGPQLLCLQVHHCISAETFHWWFPASDPGPQGDNGTPEVQLWLEDSPMTFGKPRCFQQPLSLPRGRLARGPRAPPSLLWQPPYFPSHRHFL